jgi:hypothetical protein
MECPPTGIILTIPANVLARAHGFFPGTVTDVLGVVNRILPAADGHGTAMARGLEVEQRLRLPLFGTVTAWGHSAAERFNQFPSGRSYREGYWGGFIEATNQLWELWSEYGLSVDAIYGLSVDAINERLFKHWEHDLLEWMHGERGYLPPGQIR